MIAHLSIRQRRRPWLERIGLRRDLSERLILRIDEGTGGLVDETAGWVAKQEVDEFCREWSAADGQVDTA